MLFRQTSALARSSEVLRTFMSVKAETCQSARHQHCKNEVSGSSLRRRLQSLNKGKCSAATPVAPRGGLRVRMVRAGVMVGG